MNVNDFTSIDSIIAEVSSILDDSEFSHGFSKGWYISRAKDAITELAIDTHHIKATVDLDLNTDRLALDMPTDAFNIREIYLHNGDCSPATSKIVHWKRLFNNRGNGTGHTAKIKEGQSNSNDPFFGSTTGTCGNICYANIQNGVIMFSSQAKGYSKVRLVYNGLGGNSDEMPIVPRFFKRAVVDYIEERYFLAMKARDPRKWRGSWTDAFKKKEVSMQRARIRVSSMDTWEKESLEEYISNMIHK